MLGLPIIAPNGMSLVIWSSLAAIWAFIVIYIEHKEDARLKKRAEDLLEKKMNLYLDNRKD